MAKESTNIEAFREAIREGSIEWRMHAFQRLAERGISRAEVLTVLLAGEKIEDYPDDTPYPSALFLGFPSGKPLHAVAAFDEINKKAYVVTAYEPSSEFFEEDYKTRRTP